MEMERERQEEERLEAEARVAELEDKVEELQGDLDNMYDSYYWIGLNKIVCHF